LHSTARESLGRTARNGALHELMIALTEPGDRLGSRKRPATVIGKLHMGDVGLEVA